jgi:hypothetical protein
VEVTDLGGWGPRINGGAWLLVDEQRVDWIYREIESVAGSIADVRAGRSPLEPQPGHPFGWQPQMEAGEVAAAVVLADRNEAFATLRRAVVPYPAALRAAKVRELWEARFFIENAAKPAERRDAVTVMGHLYRALMIGVQAVFAVNGRYLVNEKGAVAAAAGMPHTVVRLAERAAESVAGRDGDLAGSLRVAGELLADIERMTNPTISAP